MQVDATTAAAQPTADRGMSSLKSEDFFEILVTELQQQDPFEPTQTADMISQVSQIRSIELSEQLTGTLSQMTEQNQTAGAADLLGKFVTAAIALEDGSISEVSGVVTGVRFASDGSAVLELDTGQMVAAQAVTLITSPENVDLAPAATDDQKAGADTEAADDKSADTSKRNDGGLFSWLGDLFN